MDKDICKFKSWEEKLKLHWQWNSVYYTEQHFFTFLHFSPVNGVGNAKCNIIKYLERVLLLHGLNHHSDFFLSNAALEMGVQSKYNLYNESPTATTTFNNDKYCRL